MKLKNCFFTEILLMLGGILIVILSISMFIVNLKDLDTRYDKTLKTDLQSIDLHSQVKGSFIYGTGSIQEDEYYVVYEVQEDGGLVLVKYRAKDTIIYPTLDDDSQAYVEKDLTKYNRILKCRMYIPKNSVEKKYDLSLQ